MLRENEKGRGIFDDYYEGFLGGKVFRWLDFAKVRVVKDELRRKQGPLRIIDLGCGSASISSQLIPSFPNMVVIGADSDARLLATAAARGLETRQIDFDQPLPFEEGSFDAVLMIDTIEHVESRKSTMAEATRILKNDGTFIAFTPPHDTVAWTLGERFHRILTRRRTFDHISPFTKESLSWLLNENFSSWRVWRMNMGLTMCGIGNQKRF